MKRFKKEDLVRMFGNVQFLDARQLSQLLNVPLKTIQKWSYENRLPMVKMGKKMNRYPVDQVMDRLDSGKLFNEISNNKQLQKEI